MRTSPLLALSVVMLAACSSPGTIDHQQSSSSLSSASGSTQSATGMDVQVTAPHADTIVKSPLTITGQAKGTWYFEASFPVHLLDGNGQEIASAPAQAQSNWMTEDFVPFTVTLTFTTPATPTGTLVLEKDNPSGDPAHDAQIRIPVRF